MSATERPDDETLEVDPPPGKSPTDAATEAELEPEAAETALEDDLDPPDDEPVFDSEKVDAEEAAALDGGLGWDPEDAPLEDDESEDEEEGSQESLWGDPDPAEGLPTRGGDTADKPGLEKAPPLARGLDRLKSVLESLVFVSNKPISDRMLAKTAHANPREVRPLLLELQREYAGRGIELHLVAGGWQFRSATGNAPFVRELVAPKPMRMSRAQVESLAIVAYRQPITRPEVDEIRGVDSGPALKLLADRNLLKILGRKDEPGRPLLYGTTEHFLEFFGLSGLKDLPTLQEFSELSDESRALFERRMGEPLDMKAVEAQARAAEAAAQEAMLAAEESQQELDLEGEEGAAESPGEASPDEVAEPKAEGLEAPPVEEVHGEADSGDDASGLDDDFVEADESRERLDEVSPAEIDDAEGPSETAEQAFEADEPISEEHGEMTDERFERETVDDEAVSATSSLSDDFDDEDFEVTASDEGDVDEDDDDLDEDDDDDFDDDDDDDDDDLDDDEDDDDDLDDDDLDDDDDLEDDDDDDEEEEDDE
jgi:segregation and condensation protein B